MVARLNITSLWSLWSDDEDDDSMSEEEGLQTTAGVASTAPSPVSSLDLSQYFVTA